MGLIHGSTTISWSNFPATPESAAGEVFGGTNKRRVEDWTDMERVQLIYAGNASAPNGSQVELQVSEDGVTWAAPGTYWDGGPGPAVFTSKGNGEATWAGPYVDIAPEWRRPVRVRYVGRGGSDSTNASFFTLGHNAVWFGPEYAASSLAGATKHTRDIVALGGSQVGGGGNPGDFQIGDATVAAAKAALDPLVLAGHAAGGITYIRDGVTLDAFGTEFGIELGILHRLQGAGKVAGARFLSRIHTGTPTPDWVATHFAELVTDVTTAGLDPSCVCYIVGGQDSTNLAAIANMQRDLWKLAWMVYRQWPGAAFVVMGCTAVDTVTFGQLERGRVEGSRIIRDNPRGTRAWIPHDSFEADLQPDDTHMTELGEYRMGFDGFGPTIEAQVA